MTGRSQGMASPNPVRVGFSILGALRVRRPQPEEGGLPPPSWEGLAAVLTAMRSEGISTLPARAADLGVAIDHATGTQPDRLGRNGALAFWLNLYNAGALLLAARALSANESTVLRMSGAFTDPFVTIDGERLSLTHVEHGKIRRFQDPRIHTALVCGSVSCPTLRYEPFVGDRLGEQLDEQARSFLIAGGAIGDGERLHLSRIFMWYGADYGRPHRMPAFLPVSKRRVAQALVPWMEPGLAAWVSATSPPVSFQPYDWGLACAVR